MGFIGSWASKGCTSHNRLLGIALILGAMAVSWEDCQGVL